MSIIKLNKTNFKQEIMNRKGVALVDFYADWCGPCKMVSPIINEIAEERSDILVGKVDVDQSPELAAEFGVMSIPTLIIFKDGEVISETVGYRPKQEILSMLG